MVRGRRRSAHWLCRRLFLWVAIGPLLPSGAEAAATPGILPPRAASASPHVAAVPEPDVLRILPGLHQESARDRCRHNRRTSIAAPGRYAGHGLDTHGLGAARRAAGFCPPPEMRLGSTMAIVADSGGDTGPGIAMVRAGSACQAGNGFLGLTPAGVPPSERTAEMGRLWQERPGSGMSDQRKTHAPAQTVHLEIAAPAQGHSGCLHCGRCRSRACWARGRPSCPDNKGRKEGRKEGRKPSSGQPTDANRRGREWPYKDFSFRTSASSMRRRCRAGKSCRGYGREARHSSGIEAG